MKYTIKESDGKAWGDENNMYTVTFEEEHSEPTIVKSPRAPSPGDTISGERRKTQSGKWMLYPPFKLDRKQANITAQWAVGNAVQMCVDPFENPEELYSKAEILFDTAMKLSEVKSE